MRQKCKYKFTPIVIGKEDVFQQTKPCYNAWQCRSGFFGKNKKAENKARRSEGKRLCAEY